VEVRLLLYWGVVQTRIKPYAEQQAELARRTDQKRLYRRNQAFGLLIVAVAICAWWLLHTNPKWLFTPGWWRW
jgi:hypothetical protein